MNTKFYVVSIEQICDGSKDDEISEYAGAKKFNDQQAAEVEFYQRLAEVSNDLKPKEGKYHLFMDIKVENSLGGILKKDQVGRYQEAE